MADRIYTQADYDKVTDLYNNYQNSKDRYTPEQQQKIESAFNNAWTSVSNWIEASKNRIADMYLDANWNTVQVYWDWRSEIVQHAPQQVTSNISSKPTTNRQVINNRQTTDNTQTVTTNPEDFIDDTWYPDWFTKDQLNNHLRLDQYINAWYKLWDDWLLYTPSWVLVRQNWYNINEQWEFVKDPNYVPKTTTTTIVNNNNNKWWNNTTTNKVWPVTSFVNNVRSIPTRVEWTIDTLKSTPSLLNNVWNTIKSYNQMTDWNWIWWIRDNIKWAANFAASIPATVNSANTTLQWINKMTNNKLSTDAVRRLLSRWYRMWSDWTIYYPDWRVFTKL